MVDNGNRPATRAAIEPIFDADIHLNHTPQVIAPYCTMPWRKSLEMLGEIPQRYLDIPGFAPSMKLDPPIPGGHAGERSSAARDARWVGHARDRRRYSAAR